jgi:cysteinyl-tRNA synthetase
MLQAHYRSNLDFTDDAIAASEKGFVRLMDAYDTINEIIPSEKSSLDIQTWIAACYDAMNDDFNTPILIAQLFEAVRYINLLKENKETITSEDLNLFTKTIENFLFDVLGLTNEKSLENNDKLDNVINMLIGMRNEARANKDFALSDKIRDQLTDLGINLKDGKEGTTFSIN